MTRKMLIFWLRKQLRASKLPTTLVHWFLLDTMMMMINAKVRLPFFRWSQSRKNGLVLTSTLNRKVSGTLNIYVKMMLVFAIHFEKFYIIGFLFCAHDKQSFIVKIEPLWRMFCKTSRWPIWNPCHIFWQKNSFRIWSK